MPALPIRNRLRGIQFLDLLFTPPTPLKLTYRPSLRNGTTPFNTTYVPSYGGLYAIVIYDAACRPLPYRLIYVGEAGSLSERVCRSHEKYASWENVANGAQLFVAFHSIANKLVRRNAEQRLIERYKPECNKTFNRNTPALRELLGLYSEENSWPFKSLDRLNTFLAYGEQ